MLHWYLNLSITVSSLNTIDCTIHKQPIMLRHCSTATTTKYPMLAVRQDAVFVMILEHEERYRDTESLHGMNFNFFSVQGKGTAALMLPLESTAA